MIETSASAWKVTEPGIYQVRRPLGRMGAPYGQYLLDDVVRGRVHAKLYVFLNAWRLSPPSGRRCAATRAGRAASGATRPAGMTETGPRRKPCRN